MAHYYTINGEPRHTQPTKPGAKNPNRPTTTKDAKEQGLFPSVSEYIKQLANGGIERYKLAQVAKTCFNRPPIADEPLEGYVQHVIQVATEDASEAAELGTAIHDAIESYYKSRPYSAEWEPYVLPTVDCVRGLGITPLHCEKVLVNAPMGYAGTADGIFERGILDFKSQRFEKKPNIYDSHVIQLAAYHMAQFGSIGDADVAYNIYISTVTPGLVVSNVWTANELRRGWTIFEHLLALYRLLTGFDPRQQL
jgi:hypothetical protein